MAFRVRQLCYCCNRAFGIQQLSLMNGDENMTKREMAIERRIEHGIPALLLNENSRLCLNCNRLILIDMRRMEEDPTSLRLNVLTQRLSHTCLICNAVNNIHLLSAVCRTDVFIKRNIYVPENTRSCEHHLDENGLLSEINLSNLRSINRPYIIRGPILQVFLEQLRGKANKKARFIDENDFTDDEFKCVSPIRKDLFQNLYTYFDAVVMYGTLRNISKKDLMTFLCKLRHGLCNDFLKNIFDYSSRQNVSLTISKVR